MNTYLQHDLSPFQLGPGVLNIAERRPANKGPSWDTISQDPLWNMIKCERQCTISFSVVCFFFKAATAFQNLHTMCKQQKNSCPTVEMVYVCTSQLLIIRIESWIHVPTALFSGLENANSVPSENCNKGHFIIYDMWQLKIALLLGTY